MAWGALAKGLMGVGKVATRTAGGGARMARRMFRRKGGKNAPKKPQQVGVGGEERGGALMVRPSSALVPLAVGAGAASASASTSGGNPNDNVEEVAIRIKTNLIDVKKLLEGTYTYREKVKEEDKKAQENVKRKKREDQIETKDTKKNRFKLPVPKEVVSFWEKVKRFFMIFFVSAFLGQIMKLKGPLMKVVKVLAKVVDVAINIAGWVLNIAVSIVDGLYKMVDGLRGLVKNIFGEKGLEMFDTFLGWMNKVVNAAIIAATIISIVAAKMAASSWAALFAKGAAVTTTAATAATTGGVGATAGGIGTAATVGIVAGTGLLASGLGEGAFQMKKKGQEAEATWYRRYKEKWWTDPRKAVDWGILQIIKGFNFITGIIGTTLDIIGAPFRYLVELIRYPFLDEAGKAKQRENLAKFDARIREQFREIVNAFSLGLLAKDKGAFGSIYGKEGTDAMGYTKDGKTKSQQLPAKKGKILLSTPDLVATQDLLLGKPSGQKVHTILKMTSEGEDITSELNKPKGLWRGITGVADFMTFGMFDFDQRNRKGSPKDFGVRRVAGGLADYATLGITDFDKRGAGVMQVDPMFGGKDKAWGSRNEQAKRREKQSGFGLKRGIGGLLDFATFGMFDFDKQNRRGAPKGFGIKRIVGGLADVVTGGATDFDKRGTGIGQIKLGEMMLNKKRREAFENNPRVHRFSENYLKIAGERFIPGQPLSERQYHVATMGMQMGNKYNDEVLRSYAMYEQGGSVNSNIIIMKQQTTTPVMVGGNDGGTLIIEDSAVASDDSESYASYQGH